jgi:subtilisin family serine protease
MRNLYLTIALIVLFVAPHAAQATLAGTGQICCLLESGADIDAVNAQWGTETLRAAPELNLYLLYADGIPDIYEYAAEMCSDPLIIYADANLKLETPEAIRQMVMGAVGGGWSFFHDQELAQRIGLAEAHQFSMGNEVVVAVLDNGIDLFHQAFDDRLSPGGYDFIDDDAEPMETHDGIDNDEDGFTDEGLGHGTMVAGVIALVAPQAEILPIRVLDDEGRGSLYSVAQGLLYALSYGADVISMSFGCTVHSEVLEAIFEMAAAQRVVAVAGAGNRGQQEPPYYPAADPNVYMIAALDTLDIKAEFSDYHPDVTVSAPGVGVLSAYPDLGMNDGDEEWGIADGCSFATPIVAGEAALIRSIAPGIGGDELRTWIQDAVAPIYQLEGNEPYAGMLGSGRIDLALAMQNLAGAPGGVAAARPRLFAWPNPSRGPVSFRLPDGVDASISIVDLSGRLIRRLASSSPAAWDGRDRTGRPVAPGFYWVRLDDSEGGRPIPLTIIR